MRTLLQVEAAECGLASLAMVADAHGLRLTMPEMRRRFPLSLKGMDLSHLIHLSQELGFKTRGLRTELEGLPQLELPCILHWDLNHFVVLAKVGRSGVEIVDPALGKRSLSFAEVSHHFTGVVLELSPAATFKPKTFIPTVSIGQLTGSVRGIWGVIAQVLLLSLALQVFVVLAPLFMQWVIDQVLVSADRSLLAVLGIGFCLVLFLQAGVGLLRGWTVTYLSGRIGLQWMGNVFEHLIRLPMDFFEKRHLGDITSRMNSVHVIQQTLTNSFIEAVIDGLMAIVTLALMLVYSWQLALITLLASACYFLIRIASYRSMRDSSELQLVAAAKQQSHLLESMRGMQSLKIAGEEFQRSSAYGNLMVDTVNLDIWLARMSLGFNTASQLVFGLERVAVIWIGAMMALDNVFSVGMLVAYLAYKDQFSQRISSLIDKSIEFSMLRLHTERLSDIVLTPPDNAGDHPALPLSNAGIVAEGLSFRYGDGEPWVLKDCSFIVKPGESVAVVGVSGSGKTTLVKIMLGLLKPTEGVIRVGGNDLAVAGARNARMDIGAVMQDDQLFAGSIADNISFFSHDFDQERIEEVARIAAIHEEILMMPMGYQSLIGDMGSSLSGGQKQRIILARALYRSPKLLFLDEATSHLDVANEHLVNVAINQLDVTRVIVAHRPETIACADRVVRLEAGKVAG